jgi:hypothetical protein
VEDASFYCDILIPQELIRMPEVNYQYSIRVSNFGNLTTIEAEENIPETTLQIIKEKILQQNFVYISPRELENAYDGNFIKFYKIPGNSKPTWWIRYFDYL